MLLDIETALPLDFTVYFTEKDDENVYETDLTGWCAQLLVKLTSYI